MMPLASQTTLRVVLYEGNGTEPLAPADRFAAMSALLERGFAVTRVTATAQVAPPDRTALLVLGRFDGGKPPQAEDALGHVNVTFEDITGLDSNRIAETVETNRLRTNA